MRALLFGIFLIFESYGADCDLVNGLLVIDRFFFFFEATVKDRKVVDFMRFIGSENLLENF